MINIEPCNCGHGGCQSVILTDPRGVALTTDGRFDRAVARQLAVGPRLLDLLREARRLEGAARAAAPMDFNDAVRAIDVVKLEMYAVLDEADGVTP